MRPPRARCRPCAAPGTDGARPPARASGDGLREPWAVVDTTMFTSLGARTITLRTVASASSRWTVSDAMAAASRSASVMSAGTSRRSRTLPLIWTTAVTVSCTSSAGSTVGHGARTTVSSWPIRCHMSSAVYGATRLSRIATASTASRTAGSAGPQPVSMALRTVFTSSMVRAMTTLNFPESSSCSASATVRCVALRSALSPSANDAAGSAVQSWARRHARARNFWGGPPGRRPPSPRRPRAGTRTPW